MNNPVLDVNPSAFEAAANGLVGAPNPLSETETESETFQSLVAKSTGKVLAKKIFNKYFC